jgi:hypothetical protein
MTNLRHLFALNKLLLRALCLCAMLSALPVGAYAAGGKSAGVSDSPFIAQTQVASSVLVSFRPVGLMQVDLGVLVRDPGKRARVSGLQPVLRNAWRRTTQEFTNSYFTPGRVPDAALLGQRLQAATDEVLGPGVGRVLLISVLVR